VPAVTLPIGAERRSAGERATVLEVSGIVYLDARHDRGVKRPARKAKTSETEVIRRAIDACERGEMEVAATQRRRHATLAALRVGGASGRNNGRIHRSQACDLFVLGCSFNPGGSGLHISAAKTSRPD
jgi:hypothetical protein